MLAGLEPLGGVEILQISSRGGSDGLKFRNRIMTGHGHRDSVVCRRLEVQKRRRGWFTMRFGRETRANTAAHHWHRVSTSSTEHFAALDKVVDSTINLCEGKKQKRRSKKGLLARKRKKQKKNRKTGKKEKRKRKKIKKKNQGKKSRKKKKNQGCKPSSWEPKAAGSSGRIWAVKRVVRSADCPWRSCLEKAALWPGVEVAGRGSQPGRAFCCHDAGD